MVEQVETSKWLSRLIVAFDKLREEHDKEGLNSVSIQSFTKASALLAEVFEYLGFALKFAAMDILDKVDQLSKPAVLDQFSTLGTLLQADVKENRVATKGSLARMAHNLKRAVDFVHTLLEQIISRPAATLQECATATYDLTLERYHPYTIRCAVGAGLRVLPTRESFLKTLDETESSVETLGKKFLASAAPIRAALEEVYSPYESEFRKTYKQWV